MGRLTGTAALALAGLAFVLSAASSSLPRPQVKGGGEEWVTTGGDAEKSHFSKLTDINASNVARLGLAWQADLGTNRGMEATPIVLDGILYVSGVAGRVYARDAATGREIWTFEPEIDPLAQRGVCCDNVNRGISIKGNRLFVAALDAKLYALDLKTGRILWTADTVEDRTRAINSTGAPEVAGDVVVIGNSGAEYDVRGYVTAYDAATGKQRWRFHTVPRDPKLGPQDHPDLEAAAKTWDPNSRWDIGGGGTPWDAINYDPETGLVLVGTGNGGPYNYSKRSPAGGDNLYLASIVALDPKTGRVRWHYQETPGDNWDYTATAPILLTRMAVDGASRPVLIHAPKNGFLYVIDRRDGKLLRASQLTYTNWASSIDLKTGKPNFDREASDYSDGPKIIYPATPGAHNWTKMALSPRTGLLYVSVLEMGNVIFMSPGPKPRQARAINNDASLLFGPDIAAALPVLPPPIAEAIAKLPAFERVKKQPFVSEIRAVDPLTGKTVWAQKNDGWQDHSGLLATASGLVFSGDVAGRLKVFDARTGKLLKSIDTGNSILAAPMTYKVGGVQYVAVTAGWGGGGWPYVPRYAAPYQRHNANRILVFKLDGGPVPLPDKLPPLEVAGEPPPQAPGVTAATIGRGRDLFFTNCAICHSNQHRSISPDLRRMAPATHEAFEPIVLGGLLEPNGMPGWGDLFSKEDAAALHAYLIDLQATTRKEELERVRKGEPIDAPSLAILSSF